MSSPQPLPLLLNVLAWLLGWLIKFFHLAKYLAFCRCIRGRTGLREVEEKSNKNFNVRYLGKFSAASAAEEDDEQSEPFLRSWSGATRSDGEKQAVGDGEHGVGDVCGAETGSLERRPARWQREKHMWPGKQPSDKGPLLSDHRDGDKGDIMVTSTPQLIHDSPKNSSVLDEEPSASQRLANFLSRPFHRLNKPLKRTKSVSKIDRPHQSANALALGIYLPQIITNIFATPNVVSDHSKQLLPARSSTSSNYLIIFQRCHQPGQPSTDPWSHCFRFKRRPELSKCSEENLVLHPDLRPIYGYSCAPSTANTGPMSMYCDPTAPFHSLNSAANNKNGFLGVDQHKLRPTRSHENLMVNQHPSLMFDFSSPNNRLQPIHPSVLNVPNCFKVNDEIYSCTSPQARTRWIESIRQSMNPDRDLQRRTENCLSIWILEAKGVPPKRRYFCELCLDKSLYARTSAKPHTDICFWGEYYEFGCIPHLEDICINLYREADPKKKKDRCTLIGCVQIKVDQLALRHPIEKWYNVSSGSENSSNGNAKASAKHEIPAIRVKARYQTVEILPLRIYSRLLDLVKDIYLPLCLILEPVLGVKAKEDLATSLVRILHKKRLVKEFLCDLIMAEVNALDNDHLMFRGNSLATKAMEAYMKLVAADYLQATLGDYVKQALESPENCEVDPLKLAGSSSTLSKNQQHLTSQAENAWGRIMDSVPIFPQQLRQVFNNLRKRLEESGRVDLANNLISSSIFLRFLCPAILSPSLFNLVSEYPSGPSARNLTLIAKTLQTLANFTKFGGKESYMEFMNEFVGREWNSMHEFLVRISRTCPDHQLSQTASDENIDVEIDLGKELSLLHSYLQEAWSAQVQEKAKQDSEKMAELWSVIVSISTYRVQGYETSTANNPPSDYENNSTNITINKSAQTHTVNAQKSTAVSKLNSVFIAKNLNTSDDYVISSAVGHTPVRNSISIPHQTQQQPHTHNGHTSHQLNSSSITRAPHNCPNEVKTSMFNNSKPVSLNGQKSNGGRDENALQPQCVHIYDDTPHEFANPNPYYSHLYDEVPSPNPSLGRFPHTARQNGMRSPVMGSTNSAKDDSDSEEDVRMKNIRHPPPRKPKKRVNGNFAASNDSTTSGGPASLPALPSSGYQSQNHSSANSTASNSPIDTSSTTLHNAHNNHKSNVLRISRPAIAIANPLCMPGSTSPQPIRQSTVGVTNPYVESRPIASARTGPSIVNPSTVNPATVGRLMVVKPTSNTAEIVIDGTVADKTEGSHRFSSAPLLVVQPNTGKEALGIAEKSCSDSTNDSEVIECQKRQIQKLMRENNELKKALANRNSEVTSISNKQSLTGSSTGSFESLNSLLRNDDLLKAAARTKVLDTPINAEVV
uniref:Ras GTPase-activating protein n=1 Tax=Ditylenchus dipsaci TaxID=166011 RepID=A0A915ECY1_9BILA